MVGRWSGSDRILFTDNLYTSPALCRHLLAIGLRSCGTFRPNRAHLPEGLRDAMKTLSTGETKAWQSGQLGCLMWCDKNPVLVLSTHHKVDDMVSLDQHRGPSQPPVVIKPQVVLDYNVGKCGVDMVDQLRSYYAMQRKSRKDWPSLAWWLIDMCVINSYTLWRLDTKADITQLDFRRALLHQIPAAYPPPPPTHTVQPPTHPPPPMRATGRSTPTSRAAASTATWREEEGGGVRLCASDMMCTCAWSLASSCIIHSRRRAIQPYMPRPSRTATRGGRHR